MIEKALHEILVQNANVAALAANRVFPHAAAQNAPFPRVTYVRMGTERIRTYQGRSGLANARMRIECWSLAYDQAKELADAVGLALDGFSGEAAGFQVQGIFLDDESDEYDLPEHADEVGVPHESLEVVIWFEEG